MGLLRKSDWRGVRADSKKDRMAEAPERRLKLNQQALVEEGRARENAAVLASRPTAPGVPLIAEELAKLVELRQASALTEAEFAARKATLLNG